MRNSDYGSLGELHPDYARDHGYMPPDADARRAARNAIIAGTITWDLPKRGTVAEKLELAKKVWLEYVKVAAGEITRSEWLSWCRDLHETDGVMVNLCFNCDSPWHPWSVDEEGWPLCGYVGEPVSFEEYMR